MRVAIANRGEVAVRIIRACQELGHRSIVLHSIADKNSLACRLADETVELPGKTLLESYLNIEAVVRAAKQAKAELLHPGFGFLSENADFAAAVSAAGIVFVGPPPEATRLVGNKIAAKKLACEAKVPVVPDFHGKAGDSKAMLQAAKQIGFPIIIKAAAGGGGKGMKTVDNEPQFTDQLASAQREALSAFGSDEVFLEKRLLKPRHVEIQVIGDIYGNYLHFGERDCSVQRRFQKIIEESPSGTVTPELREQLTAAALRLCKAADYANAGTVEFLVDADGSFYFMEMNTRLQVEHPVTEMVYGIDLVKLQFAVAQEEPLKITQAQCKPRGHALEVRIYAEDPANQFLPAPGRLPLLELPPGPHRRFDFGYATTDVVPTEYDPMLGKIITWGESRAENLQRMIATLNETIVFGVPTNIEFLKAVLSHPRFVDDRFSTAFLAENFGAGFTPPPPSSDAIAWVYANASRLAAAPTTTAGGLRYSSPWSNSGSNNR